MANRSSYTLNPLEQKTRPRRFTTEELSRMTEHQLRDICETETIVSPHLEKLGKPDLIDLILQLRGDREPMLIREDVEDGTSRLQQALRITKMNPLRHHINLSAKVTVFEGLDTNYFDGYTIPYSESMDGVNAVVFDNQKKICAILNVESYPGQDHLYLTRSGRLPCQEAEVTDYQLVIFPKELSDDVWQVYNGTKEHLPAEVFALFIPLLDFVVLQPQEISMPLVIDFGTTNTVAGTFIDNQYYNRIKDSVSPNQILPDSINYINYLSLVGEETPVLPSIIGVSKIEKGKPVFQIGHNGEKMITDGYMGEGFCVFYDVKRWVSDFEKEEELSDVYGNRMVMKRKDIIKEYLEYVIENAEQRLKCSFSSLFVCYPVKQKDRFLSLFTEIFPEYHIPVSELIDEGVAVLYNTIANFIDHNIYTNNQRNKALVIDCGGGTTDLSSCTFSIENKRISYDIEIETAYENGDTDFGGNNLTFRILQLLKVEAAFLLSGGGRSVSEILSDLELDTYRVVDEYGKDVIYKDLDEAYIQAERVIPTRFKEYERATREEYFMVRNNYYYLFSLAEEVKQAFFSNTSLLQLHITSQQGVKDSIFAKRWKLAVRRNNQLSVVKEFPSITIGTVMVNQVLSADIYDIVQRFLNPLYSKNELSNYKVINLTGQSVKIGLFRDSLKEFIPGKLIRGKKEDTADDYRLKLTCIEGAIRYIRDKRLGYAKVSITQREPSLPYVLYSHTHTGEEVVLIHPLNREKNYGAISRAIQSVELRLFLSDTQGNQKYIYNVFCNPDEFSDKTYEEIQEMYGDRIPQSEVDIIENGEVRYFIWVDKGNWGFNVLPISRRDEILRLGNLQFFPFENESWLLNFFDGTH